MTRRPGGTSSSVRGTRSPHWPRPSTARSPVGTGRICTGLADGRRIGYPDDDYEPDLWLDHEQLKVARELRPGDEFEYVFDFGADWRHRCRVHDEKVDPVVAYGQIPERPAVIWGWGSIPDQYGRERP